MKNLKEILKELRLEKLLENKYSDEIKIIEVDKGTLEEMYGYSNSCIWYIIRGSVKGNSYLGDDAGIYWSVKEKQWFGFSDSILGLEASYDLEAMTGCVVLEIPMKKLYNDPDLDLEVFKTLVWHMAMTNRLIEEEGIKRIGFSDEGYFFKHLEDNNFSITYRTQEELSDLLSINSRTFQRILKVLKENGVIELTRGRIEVKDKEKFYNYAEENGVWS